MKIFDLKNTNKKNRSLDFFYKNAVIFILLCKLLFIDRSDQSDWTRSAFKNDILKEYEFNVLNSFDDKKNGLINV